MRLLLVIVSIALFPFSLVADYRISVSAAPVDRAGLVLRVPLPPSAPGLVWLRDNARAVAVQREADGSGTAILDWVPAGKALEWRLEAGSPAAEAVKVSTRTDAIDVTVEGRPVLGFPILPRKDVPEAIRRAGYLHPVFSPAGLLVTDDYPSNHPHHHGIWAPWTKTSFQGREPDFWNMHKGTGAEQLVKIHRTWSGPVHGGLEAELRMSDLSGSAREPLPVLTSRWTVTCFAAGPEMRLFELRIEQNCAGPEALGLPEYHYGGFGIRGASEWNGPGEVARFLTSEGISSRKEGNGTRARWCYLGGKVGGAQAGTAVLGHPENFRAPQPVRLHPDMPYFSYVPQQLGGFAIEPGKPYVARFRFVVTDGEPDAKRFEACWQALAHPAVVTMQAASAPASAPPVSRVVVNADRATLHPGGQELIPVLSNDYTRGGKIDPGTLAIETPPTRGTARVIGRGNIEYTHNGPGFEPDSLVYRVSTKEGESGTAKVSISVTNRLRLVNATLNVPAAPPSTAYEWTDALPGLSFGEPCGLETMAGQPSRLFVLEKKAGIIRVVPDLAASKPEARVFLDLKPMLQARGESLATENEQGILGLAFHPRHAENRQFFVFYSAKKPDGRWYERVSRFQTKAEDPLQADANSEAVLIEQHDQAYNHQGSCLRFGPDGYLYISLGDEGGQNDQYGNGQNLTKNFFSGILRIDVDRRSGSLEPNPHAAVPLDQGKARYAIPADNPFVHQRHGGSWDGMLNGVAITTLEQVRTEFWAIGMRNPWQMHFDAKTGELWVADVGGGSWEEVNVVTRGGNYGWPYREGTNSGPKKPTPAESGFQGQPPLHAYPHGSGTGQGNSITGGLVYRGTRFPELAGTYLFADYASGNLWSLRRREGQPPHVARLTGKSGLSAFHTDPANGDLLAADYTGGKILRLVAGKPGTGFPQKLSETRLFTRTQELIPAPSVLPYTVNHPAWNDHALARHWFVLPGNDSRVAGSRDGNWSFPTGMIWVQHLDLETERGNPQTARRVETRLLVKTEEGAYGVSYRWNEAGTEATLVPEAGEEIQIPVREPGGARNQTWRFPAQAECAMCHNATAGYALSFSTRQLNRESVVGGFPGNQLDLWSAHGLLQGVPASAEAPKHAARDDSRAAAADRARGYLAVNCANCHQPGGLSPTPWNLRPEIPLDRAGIINGLVINHGGDSARRIIAPGDPVRSQILTRMTATDGFLRMPLVGTRETDVEAVALLKEWIVSLPK